MRRSTSACLCSLGDNASATRHSESPRPILRPDSTVYRSMSTHCTFAYRRVPTPRQEHTLLPYFEIRRPNRRLEPTTRYRTRLEQGVTPPRSLLPLAQL